MKYILNEQYANQFFTTTDGHIFKKEVPTEVSDEQIPEMVEAIKSKIIIPFTEELKELKSEVKNLEGKQRQNDIGTNEGMNTKGFKDGSLEMSQDTITPPTNEERSQQLSDGMEKNREKAKEKNSESNDFSI